MNQRSQAWLELSVLRIVRLADALDLRPTEIVAEVDSVLTTVDIIDLFSITDCIGKFSIGASMILDRKSRSDARLVARCREARG